ncbi:hypothetical protein [Escherichia phage ST4]|nr:hypothetical protein [Escherichia phage ST4]
MIYEEYYVFKKGDDFIAMPDDYIDWHTTPVLNEAFSVPNLEEVNKVMNGVMLTRGMAYKIDALEGASIYKVTTSIEVLKP